MSTQAEWETYAVNIADTWNLCADCMVSGTGKKLYRQYNFYRSILGLPSVQSPIDNTESCANFMLSTTYHSGILGEYVSIFAFGGTNDISIIYQQGKLLQNPHILVPFVDQNIHLLTGTIFDFYKQLITSLVSEPSEGHQLSVDVRACQSTGTGAPGPVFDNNLAWSKL